MWASICSRAKLRCSGKLCIAILLAGFMLLGLAGDAHAQSVIPMPGEGIIKRTETPDDVVLTLEIVFMMTILTLVPSILVLMTGFTRIVVVLSFLRRALSTQELPPNQVIIGLSLFLTFMVMRPTIDHIKNEALIPYLDADISQKRAFDIAHSHMREFMFSQTSRGDMEFFILLARLDLPDVIKRKHIPTSVLIPAFVISELKRAFQMGFMIYLPFVIIDLIVSSTLISMGMLVLPPILISLPFKILLFILVDGWQLIIGSLVASFYH